MCDQDKYTKGKRVNYKSLLRKEEQKLKRLQKEQERLARAPSCRLGKNDKKQTARTNIILDEERIQEASATEKPQHNRVVLRKQKRKLSHRDLATTRSQVTEHLPDLEEQEFQELTVWSRNLNWYLEQIDKEQRKIKRAWKAAEYEMEEEKKSAKYYQYLQLITARRRNLRYCF
jgi:hypothetical protein